LRFCHGSQNVAKDVYDPVRTMTRERGARS